MRLSLVSTLAAAAYSNGTTVGGSQSKGARAAGQENNQTAIKLGIVTPAPVSGFINDSHGHRIPKAYCLIRGDDRPLVENYYTDIWGAGWDPRYLHGDHGEGERYKGLMDGLNSCGDMGVSFHYRIEELDNDEPYGWQFHVQGSTQIMQTKCIQQAIYGAGAPPVADSKCREGPRVVCEPATERCPPPPMMGDGINYQNRKKMWAKEAEKKKKEENAKGLLYCEEFGWWTVAKVMCKAANKKIKKQQKKLREEGFL